MASPVGSASPECQASFKEPGTPQAIGEGAGLVDERHIGGWRSTSTSWPQRVRS